MTFQKENWLKYLQKGYQAVHISVDFLYYINTYLTKIDDNFDIGCKYVYREQLHICYI